MPGLTYWWEILFHGKDQEPLYISPKQADGVKAAIAAGKSHVQLNGEVVAVSAIKRVMETIAPIEQATPLMLGVRDDQSHEPLVNPENGCVRWKWAKREVSRKRWETYYSKVSAYRALDLTEAQVVVGYKQILETNQRLAPGAEWCNDDEQAKLDLKAGTQKRTA